MASSRSNKVGDINLTKTSHSTEPTTTGNNDSDTKKTVLIHVQSLQDVGKDGDKSSHEKLPKTQVTDTNGHLSNGNVQKHDQNIDELSRRSTKSTLLMDEMQSNHNNPNNHDNVDKDDKTRLFPDSNRRNSARSHTSRLSSGSRRSSVSLWRNLRNVIRVGSAMTTAKKRKKKSTTQRVDSFLQKFTIREENTG